MRKLVIASMLALAVMASSACKEPDPNKFETHIERIKDPEKRSQGFSGLERLVKTVASAQENDDLLQEFAEKVVPVFEEIWDDAKEQQKNMLQICLDIGHPGCAPVWNKAIMLDGSAEAREATMMALEGVKKARAEGSLDTLIGELDKLAKDPKNDTDPKDENANGSVRELMVDTLGEIGSPKAVPVLTTVLQQTIEKQPVKVHRAAAEAMGEIGDPAATDALLTATYRVPDIPTTTNIAEKAKIALASIGESAVPRVLTMLKGEHEEVQKLAAEHGLSQVNIQMGAAAILGTIGSSSAVDDLMAYMPTDECTAEAADDKGKDAEDEDEDEEAEVAIDGAAIRAQFANALGFIADEKAVDKLCTCSTFTKNPGDMFSIAEALGRIGGDKAVTCLVGVINDGVYESDAVESPEFVHEIQWEAGRFAVLAANHQNVDKVKAAIDSSSAKDPKVAENSKAWEAGIKTLQDCKEDLACFQAVVDDPNADWFAREVAAINAARLGMGNAKVAESIAKAYKVRNPDARVTMAWLSAHVMQGKPCDVCAEALDRVIEDEKMSRPPKEYQLSVLTARYSMGKLRTKGGGGGGAAKAKDGG